MPVEYKDAEQDAIELLLLHNTENSIFYNIFEYESSNCRKALVDG